MNGSAVLNLSHYCYSERNAKQLRGNEGSLILTTLYIIFSAAKISFEVS